jgi:hypothetical protein
MASHIYAPSLLISFLPSYLLSRSVFSSSPHIFLVTCTEVSIWLYSLNNRQEFLDGGSANLKTYDRKMVIYTQAQIEIQTGDPSVSEFQDLSGVVNAIGRYFTQLIKYR